jgi:hypothetical protein
MTGRPTALILAFATAGSVMLAAQSPATPFVVAVGGTSDAIIPFAAFDGRRWRQIWPEPANADADPIPVERLPATWWGRSTFQSTWESIEPNGRRQPVQITGTAASNIGSGCANNLGLTTDAPAKTFVYGAALATNRSGILKRLDTLTPDTGAWRTILALLPDIYRRHEVSGWRNVAENFHPNLAAPPVDRARSRQVGVELEPTLSVAACA